MNESFFDFLNNRTEDGGSWFISAHEHKSYYESAEDFIKEDELHHDSPLYKFKDDEQRQLAIDTNSIFHLHWYQRTPVSFVSYAAPTMDLLEAWVREDNDD